MLTVFVFFLLQRIKYAFEPERLLILKLFGGFDVHVVSGEVKRGEFDLVPEMLVPDLEAGKEWSSACSLRMKSKLILIDFLSF